LLLRVKLFEVPMRDLRVLEEFFLVKLLLFHPLLLRLPRSRLPLLGLLRLLPLHSLESSARRRQAATCFAFLSVCACR
jgi:hypothetical protein